MSPAPAKKPLMAKANKRGFCTVFGIKAALIIVGFILLIAALSLSYLCAWTVARKLKYALLASSYIYATSTYLLLFCTSLTSLAVVCLFWVAWIEHRQGLKLTLLVLTLTLFFETASGLLAFAYTVNLEERFSKNLLATIQHKYRFDEGKTVTFDMMQKRFRCCGSKSFKDWQLNAKFNLSMAAAVPDSCCKSYEPECAQKPYGKHPSNIFYEGCSMALYRFYHTHLITLGCVTMGVSVLQIFTIILLIWLMKRVQKTKANTQSSPTTKTRRLSNEITYYPIQTSPSVK